MPSFDTTHLGQKEKGRLHLLELGMATERVRVGYPRVSGLAGSGSGMIFDPRFSGSGPLNLSGSISDLVFHPWIPETCFI